MSDRLLEGARVDAGCQPDAHEATAELRRIDVDGQERAPAEAGPVGHERTQVREHGEPDHLGVDRAELVGLDGDGVTDVDAEIGGGLAAQHDLAGAERGPALDDREGAERRVAAREDRGHRPPVDLGGRIELEHRVVQHLRSGVEGRGHRRPVGVAVPAPVRTATCQGQP